MLKTRIIPALLLKGQGFVKTIKFKNPVYLGDPINIVKIFNDKEVDELMILDIDSTVERRPPNFDLLFKIASECFMPLGYGGGITEADEMKRLFYSGFEKVSINSAAFRNSKLITEAANLFGSQSVVVSIDAKRNFWGKYEVFTEGGKKNTKLDPISFARQVEDLGSGEILINSIDRDGTMQGYDMDLIKGVVDAVNVPVIVCGGASKKEDLVLVAKETKASAAAAGSMFVFQGKHKAVLINMPTRKELEQAGMP
jgi:cyclase